MQVPERIAEGEVRGSKSTSKTQHGKECMPEMNYMRELEKSLLKGSQHESEVAEVKLMGLDARNSGFHPHSPITSCSSHACCFTPEPRFTVFRMGE